MFDTRQNRNFPIFVNDISVPQICIDKPVHRRVENKFRRVDIGD